MRLTADSWVKGRGDLRNIWWEKGQEECVRLAGSSDHARTRRDHNRSPQLRRVTGLRYLQICQDCVGCQL